MVEGSVHEFEVHYSKYILKKKLYSNPFILFLGKGNNTEKERK